MPTVRTVTLGCKVNQYETEYVRQGLLRAGYREVRGDEPADLCIVNTCTVTLEGDYKSRKLIRQLARDNPGTEIVAMGCYATRAAGEVAALPGVVEVLTDKRQLPELLARFGLVHAPRGISSFGRMHRAYVKVQDGCAMQCSYCIVPKVRPNVWSRPVEDILEEIRQLVHHGHREIILTGIHLGHYGVGLPGAGEGADTARSKKRHCGAPTVILSAAKKRSVILSAAKNLPRFPRSFAALRMTRATPRITPQTSRVAILLDRATHAGSILPCCFLGFFRSAEHSACGFPALKHPRQRRKSST